MAEYEDYSKHWSRGESHSFCICTQFLLFHIREALRLGALKGKHVVTEVLYAASVT